MNPHIVRVNDMLQCKRPLLADKQLREETIGESAEGRDLSEGCAQLLPESRIHQITQKTRISKQFSR